MLLTERLDEDDTWQRVIEHIGLHDMPRPTDVYNSARTRRALPR